MKKINFIMLFLIISLFSLFMFLSGMFIQMKIDEKSIQIVNKEMQIAINYMNKNKD